MITGCTHDNKCATSTAMVFRDPLTYHYIPTCMLEKYSVVRVNGSDGGWIALSDMMECISRETSQADGGAECIKVAINGCMNRYKTYCLICVV